jgi:hypothetical protein
VPMETKSWWETPSNAWTALVQIPLGCLGNSLTKTLEGLTRVLSHKPPSKSVLAIEDATNFMQVADF